MPGDQRPPIDPQFADLNAAGMIYLCQSLSDYAEAGGLSRDLMLRVGHHASSRYADELDVLLAVARMYQVGGELQRARGALLRAGKLAPNDARLLPLLGEVLLALGVQESPADVLAAAENVPLSSRPEPLSSARPPPRSRALEQGRGPPDVPRRTTPMPSALEQGRGPPDVPPRRTTPMPGRAVTESVRPSTAAMESVRPSAAAMESVRPPRGSRIKLLDPEDPRRRLDPYELIGEIAAGGMASVFLARLTGAGGFQRFVAIKRLHPHLAREPDCVEMFLDEGRLAAGIHHPHVVPILEIGESDAGYHLVMEFIEGDTLATLASRAFARGVMLPRGVAARILFDALNGLHAAHQLKDVEGRLLGLIHRDCSPQNILVGTDGTSRITDFGVARSAARYAITRSQVVKGKVAYLSPEQATGGGLDRRSDLFSMGIVLWETLAGRPLFLSDHDAVTISRLLSQPIPSIRNFSPDVSAALDDVCARALQRDATKRFPTAAAMAEAIERAARSSPGGLASPSDVTRCIEDLLGAELTAQRDAVRSWIAQQDSAASSRSSRMLEGRATGPRSVSAPELKEPTLPPPPAVPEDAESSAPESPPAKVEAASDAAAAAPDAPAAAPPTPAADASPREAPEAAVDADLAAPIRRRTWVLVAALLVIALGLAPFWVKRLLQILEE
jgi:eukaryotic-like serine/threonine-protein kinase